MLIEIDIKKEKMTPKINRNDTNYQIFFKLNYGY